MNAKTRRLTESAMCIALAIVLEIVSKLVIPELPYGGQITLASMLPILLISYRHGIKWGVFTSLTYAVMEMIIGIRVLSAAFQPGYFGDGAMSGRALTMCLLDYLLAFTILGIAGFLRSLKNRAVGFGIGCFTAMMLRYLFHILSGYILFGAWAEWFFTQEGFPSWGADLVSRLSPKMLSLVYSVVYNGMYMIPEMILTIAVAIVITLINKTIVKTIEY